MGLEALPAASGLPWGVLRGLLSPLDGIQWDSQEALGWAAWWSCEGALERGGIKFPLPLYLETLKLLSSLECFHNSWFFKTLLPLWFPPSGFLLEQYRIEHVSHLRRSSYQSSVDTA